MRFWLISVIAVAADEVCVKRPKGLSLIQSVLLKSRVPSEPRAYPDSVAADVQQLALLALGAGHQDAILGRRGMVIAAVLLTVLLLLCLALCTLLPARASAPRPLEKSTSEAAAASRRALRLPSGFAAAPVPGSAASVARKGVTQEQPGRESMVRESACARTPTLLGRMSTSQGCTPWVRKALADVDPDALAILRQAESMAQAARPASPSVRGSEDFCPDLVVPQGCECVLLVPSPPPSGGSSNVCDVNGHVVLNIIHENLIEADWQITLAAGSGQPLAKCRLRREPDRSDFDLFRASGDCFATLISDGHDRYALSGRGRRLHFWGSFSHHAVNVTDDSGVLLATTELCSATFDRSRSYYRLRVAPLADVGLVLCSLLCIDFELSKASKRVCQ